MKTLDDAPFVDTFTEEYLADPEKMLRPHRGETWLVRTPMGGLAIARDQAHALLADRRLRSSVPDLALMQGASEGTLYDRLTRSVIALEGEEHARLRSLVNRAFTPRAIETRRPRMRALLVELVEPLRPTGVCEFVGDVADHYPILVMCDLLGVPREDHDDFITWNRSLTHALSFHLGEHLDEVGEAMGNMDDYTSALLADRRRHPADDLVSALAAAKDADDALSDEEIQTMVASLLFAGYDTTRNQLGLALWLFAQHPDQWELLAREPGRAAPAVEEVMRHTGAVAVVPRIVVEPVELDGYRLEPGTMMLVGAAAANHDPAVYDHPRDFDVAVDREPHLTFGAGRHFCLGASLARAEMQEALALLPAWMPDLALDGEPVWRSPFGIYGPEALPLQFTPSG